MKQLYGNLTPTHPSTVSATHCVFAWKVALHRLRLPFKGCLPGPRAKPFRSHRAHIGVDLLSSCGTFLCGKIALDFRLR